MVFLGGLIFTYAIEKLNTAFFFIISDQLGMMFMQANWILVVSYLSKAEISCIFFRNSGKMEWNEKKDILLCLEVLQAEPYRAKEKTVGRAQAWEKIANILNQRAEFKVNKRSVRDHYMVLVEKFKKKTTRVKSQWHQS